MTRAQRLDAALAALPKDGSMAWLRAWYGDRFKRGAVCQVFGQAAHVLSARDGYVNLRVWSTGKRVTVRPGNVEFADVAA